MTYSAVPTVANGDSWSAAQHNTYLRDNEAALWPYTTAGDMAYATASNALGRLGIGGAGAILRSTGSAPSWLALGSAYQMLQSAGGGTVQWGGLKICSVRHNTTQTVATGSPTALAFNSDVSDVYNWHDGATNNSRITVDANGYYQASAFVEYAGAGGSGTYFDTVEIRLNGVVLMDDRRYQEIDAFAKKFIITTPIFNLTASQYVEVYLEQNSGGTRTVQATIWFSLWRVL